ncbi:MAG: ComEC/Rec2 family competence protein [Pyrinomonadaceae bacterium]
MFPNKTTMLIDGGGQLQFGARQPKNGEAEVFTPDRRSIGEAVVSEYLWWRGLDHIDYIAATHADADHIAGLTDVVRNFSVRMALVGRTPSDDKEYERFAQSLKRESVPLEVISGGDILRAGEVEIEVLWPPPTSYASAPYRNNDSLVLRIQHKRRSVLLTGDVEASAERQLLLRRHESLASDVVKVAHHGSRTSSTERFVEAVQPSIAVISVGQASPYGHPAQEVMERWEQQGAQVLTTGSAGTITVMTDGDNLQLETFVPR